MIPFGTDVSELPDIYRALGDQLGGAPELEPGMTMADVRHFVRGQIIRLLDENPAFLMSILYRIDVAESDVQDVLASCRHEVIPDRLADLIIERQLEKLRIRRAYRD